MGDQHESNSYGLWIEGSLYNDAASVATVI